MSSGTARSGRVLSFSLGEQQSLRPVEDSDAGELYDLVVADREYLARWLPWPAHETLHRTREFITRSRAQLVGNQGFQAAIIDHGRIRGVVGFHRVDWENRATSVGYWIAADAQGRGLVTRAVAALLDYGFETWKLNRVEIRAGVGNDRSRAIPERLGFVREGVLREAELIGEHYIDHVVYSMLARDWRVGGLLRLE